MQDHSVPQCPFCRQPIEGFVALASGRLCDGSGAGAESAGAALAGPEAAALPAC